MKKQETKTETKTFNDFCMEQWEQSEQELIREFISMMSATGTKMTRIDEAYEAVSSLIYHVGVDGFENVDYSTVQDVADDMENES